MLGACGRAAAVARRRRGLGQRLERGELAVELVQLDRERQELAAAQGFAAAQIMQRVLEQTRRALQRGELERRGVAPDAVDLIERLFELVAEGVFFASRLLQDRVDGLHRGFGSLQEGGEACAAHVQHAAQDLALHLRLYSAAPPIRAPSALAR